MDVDPIVVDRAALELAAEQKRLQPAARATVASTIAPVRPTRPGAAPLPPPLPPTTVPDPPPAPLLEVSERDVLAETLNINFGRVRDHLRRVSDEGLFTLVYQSNHGTPYNTTPGDTFIELHASLRQSIAFSRQLIRTVRLVVHAWGTEQGLKAFRVTDTDGREIARVEWTVTDEDWYTGEWTDVTQFREDTETHLEAHGVSATETLVVQTVRLECRGYVARPLNPVTL